MSSMLPFNFREIPSKLWRLFSYKNQVHIHSCWPRRVHPRVLLCAFGVGKYCYMVCAPLFWLELQNQIMLCADRPQQLIFVQYPQERMVGSTITRYTSLSTMQHQFSDVVACGLCPRCVGFR